MFKLVLIRQDENTPVFEFPFSCVESLLEYLKLSIADDLKRGVVYDYVILRCDDAEK